MLLISSAFHIPRSLGCFRKVGMEVEGYGVDYYTGDKSFGFNDVLPSVNAISLWSLLIHELVGYESYKLMNYL